MLQAAQNEFVQVRRRKGSQWTTATDDNEAWADAGKQVVTDPNYERILNI